ncbi:MAG: hypothetical protein K0S65_5253, partial [Labilithrix sp.]|nr:hypothetical protein [Labilithrix sp.]
MGSDRPSGLLVKFLADPGQYFWLRRDSLYDSTMPGTAETAPDDLLTCERCHGFYAVEVPEDGGEPRVRCNACGHIREVSTAPVQKKEEEGKWTVIGPDGKVMTFGSWEKLVESRRPGALSTSSGAGSASKLAAAQPEEKRPSASALLDITPTPVLPKLMLAAELDSDPNLVIVKPKPLFADPSPSFLKSKGPEWAPVKTEAKTSNEKAPASTKKPPESIDEIDAALVDDDEPAPLSLRDAIPDDDDEPAPLSLRDAIPDDESSHEMLSLKDLTVVAAP